MITHNAFAILGIQDKELPISNLLAYYFRPENGMGIYFINKFCSVVGISGISQDKTITVEREYFIQHGKKGNSIDILILVGDTANPERIICIENKVYSHEGHEQTKRYVAALNKEFPNCIEREYIYLTKDNSAVDLSSHSFIHVKYYQLESLFSDHFIQKFPLVKDFYDYYVDSDRRKFDNLTEDAKTVKDDTYNELIDYIVYKMNRIEENGTCPYSCSCDKSAKSADLFYQVSKHSWNFEYNDMEFTFHLESSKDSLALHFEKNPYVPFSKLGKDKDIIVRIRNKARELLKQATILEVENLRLRTNAELTVAKYRIKGNTFAEYINDLRKLIIMVDKEILKIINNPI